MNNNDDTFTEMMQMEGVTPLKYAAKADLKDQKKNKDTELLENRRKAAVAGDEDGLTTGPIDLLHPLDPVEWKSDGVQEGVYRNLRLGKYQVDARLDLIRKSIPQCKDELLAFVKECIKYDIRTVLINHGRSKDKTAMGNRQKSYLNQWLQALPEVMAFHSAQPQHGGIGAIYVLLKKSDEKRLENWEQHQKR
ncbi:MAG: DNA endonuclease SmrA [Neptuniibacter sp.]